MRLFMLQLLQRAAVGAALFYVQALAWAQLPPQAQAGDLIFRQGTEAVSHMVRTVDQGLYSHVGLLVGQVGAWQVVHATPSERPGQPGGGGVVTREQQRDQLVA